MPKMFCKDCKRDISLMKQDFEALSPAEKVDWSCADCWSIIVKGDYPTHGDVLFTPIGTEKSGTGLGDKILIHLVWEEFKRENHHRKITILDPTEAVMERIKEINPAHIFYSEFACDYKKEIEALPNVIKYNMMNEICLLATRGIYPKNPYGISGVFSKPFDYAVLHIRDIPKAEFKNMPQREALDIINAIDDHMPIVVVGNDRCAYRFEPQSDIIDLRGKLTLREIAGTMQNCNLFVGKDSGLVHLAATVAPHIIAYGFNGKKWHPKMPTENYEAFLKEVRFGIVIEAISDFFLYD